MALRQWMRAYETVSGLLEIGRRARRGSTEDPGSLEKSGSPGLGQLETRLAGVVVAALKEAFDRDSTRLDLERATLETERRRAENALRLELQRQAGDRALFQLRMIAAMSVLIWVTSAILMRWLPGMQVALTKAVLGLGWAALIATLGLAFISHNAIATWLAASRASSAEAHELPRGMPALLTPWFFILGLGLTAVSLLLAL